MKKQYEENYNSPALVDLWGDFIDWKKRRKGEDGFLVDALRKHGSGKILDASLGDGCDSIYLLQKGFDVTSNEIDSLFIEKALLNARKARVELTITNHDWRELVEHFPEETFDAVFLLGNSLTYLFSKRDRVRALTAFKQVLKKRGILLIDERNYQYILDNKEDILAGKFKYSGKFVYCGSKVHAEPVEIQRNKVVMKYEHENGKKGFLVLYPFKKGELQSLLRESGFKNITRYSDYRKGYDQHADFYQYIASK